LVIQKLYFIYVSMGRRERKSIISFAKSSSFLRRFGFVLVEA